MTRGAVSSRGARWLPRLALVACPLLLWACNLAFPFNTQSTAGDAADAGVTDGGGDLLGSDLLHSDLLHSDLLGSDLASTDAGQPLDDAAVPDMLSPDLGPQPPVPTWAHGFGDQAEDWGVAVAADGAGMVCITGHVRASPTGIDFGDGVVFISAAASDIFVACYDTAAGGHLWHKTFPGKGIQTAGDLVIDGSGNVYLTGANVGEMNVDGTLLTSPTASYDIYLAAFGKSGAKLWAKSFAGAGDDKGLGLTVGPTGQIFLTGEYHNDLLLESLLYSQGGADIFIAAVDPTSGTPLWSRGFGSSGDFDERGLALSHDQAGNLVVAGETDGTVVFATGIEASSHGGFDGFVASFDAANGDPLWTEHLGGALFNDRALAVVTNSVNQIYLTGSYQGTGTFGKTSLTSTNNSVDLFLVSFEHDGLHRFSLSFGGPQDDEGHGLAVDSADNLYLTGLYHGPVALDGTTPLPDSYSEDIFIASFTADAAHRWSLGFGGPGQDAGLDVAVTSSGAVLLTGIHAAPFSFDAATAVPYVGSSDLFVASLTPPP